MIGWRGLADCKGYDTSWDNFCIHTFANSTWHRCESPHGIATEVGADPVAREVEDLIARIVPDLVIPVNDDVGLQACGIS